MEVQQIKELGVVSRIFRFFVYPPERDSTA